MVLQTALRETVRWQRDHDAHHELHIAVNVSGKQLQDA
jgi:EAL domain-containing protein (putative c-di-GMP-specific phosphodiesterase class I)